MRLYEHYGSKNKSFILSSQWSVLDATACATPEVSVGVDSASDWYLRRAWSILKAVDGVEVPVHASCLSHLLRLLQMSYPNSVRSDLFREWAVDIVKDTVYRLRPCNNDVETCI